MWVEIGAGAASVWVLSKVADGVTGWASAKVFDGVSGKLGRVLRKSKRTTGRGSHISVEPLEPPFTSRFATTRHDLDVVLDLRRSYFGRRPVSPDESYIRCWEKNRHGMKVVYRASGEPVGYWSVIPIKREVFTRFIRGQSGITHGDMLAEHTQPWSPGVSCLYVVGAVVPVSEDLKHSLGQGRLSWRVLTDAFRFAIELTGRLPLRSICGYPSRTGGYDVLDLMGFRKTKICIDGDTAQPIFSVTCARHLALLRHRLEAHVANHDHMLPAWDAGDRQRFLELIGGAGALRKGE